MGIQGNEEDDVLETPENKEIDNEKDDIYSEFLEKASLGIAPSIASGLQTSYNKMGLDVAGFRSAALKAAELGITPSSVSSMMNGMSINQAIKGLDVAGFRSAALKAAELGITSSFMNGILNNYKNTNLDSSVLEGEFSLSESLKIINEFANEIQSEIDPSKEATPTDYSEEHIQFILNSLEEWLEGSISFKNTLARIKGNDFAHWLMQTVVYGTILQLLFIFTFIGDQQLQQDRKVLETIQSYVETEVVMYKQYKKYFASSEDWLTSHPIGITRKEVRLREGRTKSAPVVSDGVVGQKTVVLMFETKNNWRRIEVKINGTYVQGWVHESTIMRLGNSLQK
ncbi:hypothetical protein [Planococcus shenhongbingii]|uniref:SH3 domain-containing protein n=1 Tax=Planococcus shenhongbingii TaxID=3058398 RepID=A0ABT8N7P8_9BACL|nr:hypothetical protein [Planococcus sp. N017]MDN7243909.1 hypothetical protein [Planococcus sp. N017]